MLELMMSLGLMISLRFQQHEDLGAWSCCRTLLAMTCLRQSEQELHAIIQENLDHKPWCLSIIYASIHYSKR